MKRLVSGAAALLIAGWMASAQAADIPYGSRVPYTVNQPLNIYSWAGPYLGANLGYAWGSVDHNPTKPSGFAGGAQAGYNWQTGPWVFGVEGDIQATAAEDTFAPWKFSNPWFGTVRGRGIVGIPHHRGLDRGCRRRIRLRAELERQGRISLCRSREQQLHHYRHVERLPVRTGARRRELSLLIATRKNPVATSRPLSAAGISLHSVFERNSAGPREENASKQVLRF